MTARELAAVFVAKAAQDERVLEKLAGDPDIADEVVGFHAQQACEKLIKAVLAARGVRFRRTHDLTSLVDLLEDHGLDLPTGLEAIRDLGPFAVEYRYELPPEGGTPLDRPRARDLIRRLRVV